MNNHQYIWVVECSFRKGKIWRPTVGVGSTRAAAKKEMAEWQRQNTGISHWRIKRYVAAK